MVKTVSKANKYLNSYKNELDSLCRDDKKSDDFLVSLERELASFGNKIASNLSEIFWNITHIFQFYNYITASENFKESDETGRDYNNNIADAFIEDQVLFIRVPLLGKRVFTSKWNKVQWVLEGAPFYRNELKAALMRVINQIKWEENHTLNYVFVYGEERIGIDSDSHDTKGITDTICSMFRGSDDSRYCSFSYATINTNAAPEGTYIAVTTGKNRFYDPSQTVEKWIEHDR